MEILRDRRERTFIPRAGEAALNVLRDWMGFVRELNFLLLRHQSSGRPGIKPLARSGLIDGLPRRLRKNSLKGLRRVRLLPWGAIRRPASRELWYRLPRSGRCVRSSWTKAAST